MTYVVQDMVKVQLLPPTYTVVIATCYLNASNDADDDKPEPEEDIDLLVNDVEGEDAEAIKLLNSPRRTELVEGALGDLGEDGSHWVPPVFWGEFGHGKDLGPVLCELAAQEEVHEVDLAHDVDKVQKLTQEEPGEEKNSCACNQIKIKIMATQPPTVMQNESSVEICTHCIHTFCTFGTNLCAQLALINTIFASELSRKFIKGPLLVGHVVQ